MRKEKLGGLDCIVTGGSDGNGGGDGPVVVLCHGFGAPGDDLVALADALPPSVRAVFPAAPLALEGGYFGGRAWWMIDLERLQRAMAGGGRNRDTSEVPSGMAEARAQVDALLDDVAARLGCPGERTVLGGFSQGAMVSLDVALHRKSPLAGVALLSGTLVAEPDWTRLAPARAGLPVFQSHGTRDPLLPFALAERLRDLLSGAGLTVEFQPFEGAHEIPMLVLVRLRAFVARALQT